MRRLWLIFMLLSFNTWCCDICNMSISLVPEDNKNIFSLNYRSRFTQGSYTMVGRIIDPTGSRHTGPGNNSTEHFGKNVTEIFSVLDIKGVYNFGERFSLTAVLPIVNNKQFLDDSLKVNLTGVGDPIIIGKYQLINSLRSRSSNPVNFRLNAGLGVKLPLGNYNKTIDNDTIEVDLQAGTGSVDLIFTTDYILRYKNVGLMQNMNFKINGSNRQNYQYGSSWNHAVNMFYYHQFTPKIAVMPIAGLYYEMANNDKVNNRIIPQSGGDVSLASLGINLYLNVVRFDFMYQHAISNNMTGNTQLPTKNRIQLGILYYIN